MLIILSFCHLERLGRENHWFTNLTNPGLFVVKMILQHSYFNLHVVIGSKPPPKNKKTKPLGALIFGLGFCLIRWLSSLGSCYGLNCASPIYMLNPWPHPHPHQVTLFGDGDFQELRLNEVIKSRTLIQFDWCSHKKGKRHQRPLCLLREDTARR